MENVTPTPRSHSPTLSQHAAACVGSNDVVFHAAVNPSSYSDLVRAADSQRVG